MAGVNKVIVLGRLGSDPEVKMTAGGKSVATFSVATSEMWTDRNGQKQEDTEWHRIVVWGKVAELCGKHLQKGSQVYIEGKNKTRSWEDDKGNRKSKTEVVAKVVQFLGGSKPSRGNDNNPADDWGPEPSFDPSDDIPF